MPVLDTSFLIALQDGDQNARQLMAEIADQPLLVPSIVAVEFLTRYGTTKKQAYQEIERAFTVVHTTPQWVLESAAHRQRLRRQRRSIRLADFWISTWAVMNDTIVVTTNEKDFRALGVKTQSW